MDNIKHSHYADGIGYLYRAAFEMAKGRKEQALAFLSIAEKKTQKKFDFPWERSDIVVAEKILDEYTKLMSEFMRSISVR